MKDRRKRDLVTWSRFFWCTLFIVVSCILYSSLTFSSFLLLPIPGTGQIHPELVSTWRNPVLEAISEDSEGLNPTLSILQTIITPDQIFVFLNYPPSSLLFNKDDIACVYLSPGANNSTTTTEPLLKLTPLYIDGDSSEQRQIIRCPLTPRGFTVTLGLKKGSGAHRHQLLPPGPTYRWNSLAYEAMIDYDNTTVVFVKGFGLRPGKLYDPTKFECVFGWDFHRPEHLLRSKVVSIGQEVARCRTPLSVLSNSNGPHRPAGSVLVSVRQKGGQTLSTVARPRKRPEFNPPHGDKELHELCACTMLLNQARALQEWIMYHASIGVQRWFIYDNNSEDHIESVIKLLNYHNFNVTRHVWPWVKSQEAGFAQCALRARGHCKWVAFIDVDEFFYSPLGLSLTEVIRNQSNIGNVGALRTFCYTFGPSGLREVPQKGVTLGYTCRLRGHERHKSIVRPEALSPSLINGVHHFNLRNGYKSMTLDRPVMRINHYKYQVWQVFKEKFYRRVATYVSDWKDQRNVGSKDRAPRAWNPSH
ncbi:hypothetical protein Ancab_002688 [Ancistrocladus abbreviatus]